VSAADVRVSCTPDADGFLCHVTVGDDTDATVHEVALTGGDLSELAGNTTEPETLVAASFAFLLERESRESILRRFDLPVIGRYFPEYPREIRARLGAMA
jgi:hypothetical protein